MQWTELLLSLYIHFFCFTPYVYTTHVSDMFCENGRHDQTPEAELEELLSCHRVEAWILLTPVHVFMASAFHTWCFA